VMPLAHFRTSHARLSDVDVTSRRGRLFACSGDVLLERVSRQGDVRKIRRRAERQGWRVEKRKEYWLFFPPDPAVPPARVAGTPSSQRSWANFLADLKRKGYRP